MWKNSRGIQGEQNMSSHAARCAVLFACAGLLLAAAPLRATVIVVDSLDTTTLPSDACSIFDAFYAVERGTAYGTCPAGSGDDVIVLPQGAVFEFARAWPEGGSSSDAVAVIEGDVVLVGNGATLQSFMSPCSSDPPPENQFRWFDVFTTGHLSLFDVTLAGGCAVGLGGGASGGSIYVSGVLELDHVTIRDSAADFAGGAIEAPQGSTLTVRDSTFVGNGGRYSHGGAIDSGGDTTVTGAYFSGNYASDGSAIASIFGEVRILNSVFADNRADSGAVSLGSAEIGFSTFSGNDGGAVKAVGDVTITASVFSGGRGGNRSQTCMFYATPPVIDAASVSDDPNCAPWRSQIAPTSRSAISAITADRSQCYRYCRGAWRSTSRSASSETFSSSSMRARRSGLGAPTATRALTSSTASIVRRRRNTSVPATCCSRSTTAFRNTPARASACATRGIRGVRRATSA
jgi:hypothetical protein